MKKSFFCVILGLVIFTVVSVFAAYTIASRDVSFNPILEDGSEDEEWEEALDVESALNILYYRMAELNGGLEYTISFDTVGGSLVSDVDTESVHYIPNGVSIPTKEGYYFVGWYDSATGGNRITSSTPIANNKTVYAYWSHFAGSLKSEVYYYTTVQEVLYNPKTRSLCDTVGTSVAGEISDCMRWWAYSEKDGIVNMILDHNIDSSGVKWFNSSPANNSNGPLTALSSLKNITDTAEWATTVQGAFATYNGSNGTNNYTLDYANDGYKARLITAQEIAYIVGNDLWNENISISSNYFYFGSLNSTDYSSQDLTEKGRQSSYSFLFGNLYNCSNDGCLNNSDKKTGNYGYWTASAMVGTSANSWAVNNSGRLYGNLSYSTSYGIRPVITVPVSEVFS